MGLIVNQEYMDEYIIKAFNRRFIELNEKLALLKNDIEFLVKEFDKVTKIIKKVK